MAGVLLVGSLAACGGGSSSASSPNYSTGSGSSDTSAEVTTSSPSPTTMSSAAYAQSLTAIGTELAPDFQAVANSHSTDDVKSALTKLSADAQTLSDGLPSNPPDPLSPSTTQLAQALRDFSTSANTTASDVGSAVCTSASALAEFTRSAGATSLRGVATSLNSVDPTLGKDLAGFLPAPIADQNRQLGNGQVLRHSSGPGSLTVKNSGTDAIVTLTKVGTKTPVASVYVRANADTTLSDIPGSTFDIYVSSGSDWDSASQKFSRQCSYQKTDSTWDFSDSDWTLTLTQQINGNLSVSTLNPGDAPNP
ncbi:hypothetical protein ABIA31_002814 [Catenulispora sp. MAP5-51]|uniref:hypothetical protein n=1 Tax=Catenulispora sp. MAP5-51 TaxID=3156298 RepID=UPI003517B980